MNEFLDIGHMQAYGWLIEYIECVLACFTGARRCLGQLSDELDALGLAARECWAGLAKGEITKPHILKQL